MRKAILVVLTALVFGAAGCTSPAETPWSDSYEVFGVDDDDMLKMRGGPGTGFIVIVGLPNGTVVRVHTCTPTGGTSWCEVSLDRARGLRGYVSQAYLRKL